MLNLLGASRRLKIILCFIAHYMTPFNEASYTFADCIQLNTYRKLYVLSFGQLFICNVVFYVSIYVSL